MRVFPSPRKICCLLLAALLALPLSACGSPEEPASSGGDLSLTVESGPVSEAASAQPESEAPSPAPGKEPVGAGRATAQPAELSAPTPEPSPTPVPARQVRLNAPASLHREPGLGIPLVALSAGQEFSVTPTENPLWYATTLEDGTVGYLYGECLIPVEGGPSLFAERFSQKVAELQEKLPQDKYWNHMGDDSIPWGTETPWSVTDIPCENWDIGEEYCNVYNGATQELFGGVMNQCLGFASLLSDQIFGEDAELHVFYDLDLLRLGDHIRLHDYEHSMTVIALDDQGVTVGECNENYENCRISWTRRVSWDELRNLSWDSEYISRYPLYPNGEGGYAVWEE